MSVTETIFMMLLKGWILEKNEFLERGFFSLGFFPVEFQIDYFLSENAIQTLMRLL